MGIWIIPDACRCSRKWVTPARSSELRRRSTGLILRDSARLQVADTERKNRKRLRAGESPEEPLYTPDDAEKILSQLRSVPYDKPFAVSPGIKAIWHDAGHMLGPTSIQLIVEKTARPSRLFSPATSGRAARRYCANSSHFSRPTLFFENQRMAAAIISRFQRRSRSSSKS
jgi:hypothetical protein